MKLSIAISSFIIGLAVSACGGKKKSQPDTQGTGDLGPYNGPPGPPGPPGPHGLPGETLNYSVKDGKGHAIGKTSWNHYVSFNKGDPFSMQLSDGAIFPVNPTNGEFAGGVFCQYVSNDCTGSCLYSGIAGISNKIIMGADGLYWLNTATTGTKKNYSSSFRDSAMFGRECTTNLSPIATMAVELPNLWSKPAGFTYPVPTPMDVSEITYGLDEFED